MSKQTFKKTKGTADRSSDIPSYNADEGSSGRELKGGPLNVGVEDGQVRSTNESGRKRRQD
jgi:hypothetical protein